VCVRLFGHINNKNILVREKFGFRSKLSTGMDSYKLISEILHALNNTYTNGGIFVIFLSFYCVNHSILL
jgi:hypothetical protein